MPSSRLSRSVIETAGQIQTNFIAYFRLFAGLSAVTFTEEDVTWFVNSKEPPGNHALRARISGRDVDRRIDEIISQIGQYSDHVDWLVFPGCQPANLGKRLEARGMKGGPGGTWMLADLTTLPMTPSVPDGFHIKSVSDEQMLEEWKKVSADGYGDDVQMYCDAYARHGFGPDAFSLHYIGYLDDQPVTSSTLLLAGGIAGVYDVSTPPTSRGRGFGSAITFVAMQEARDRDYDYAWLLSSAMGKSVYSKLGFVAADFGIREYQWRT